MPRLRAFFLLAAVTAACGGKVAVDHAASTGGAGGTTSTSSSTDNTTVVSSASASSGGENASCAQACAVLQAKGCGGFDCIAACQKGLAATPACNDVAVELLGCIRDQGAGAPGCFIEPCGVLREKLFACSTTFSCTQQVMSDNGAATSCVGKSICGSVELAVDCTDGMLCNCLNGNGSSSSCPEQGPFLCDFVSGCCALLGGGG